MRVFPHPILVITLTLTLTLTCAAERRASAQTAPRQDRYELWVHGETQAQLFQRALLPGSYGSVVANSTVLPIYEFFLLQARDVNIARQQSGFDLELAAWGRGAFGSADGNPALDGDVQNANVGYHRGPITVRFGRQHVAGGAARYARFDGLTLDADLGSGFDARAYAGLTVLPRWNERPSYTYLGAAADSALKDPAWASGTRERKSHWLGGARLGWASRRARVGLSFHEQHERGGLAHRTLTLDQSSDFSSTISAGASASAELDAVKISEARVWLDTVPATDLDVSLEWLHTEPALFLSRQSVLSVFSADNYDEAGARGALRASTQLTLEGGAWAELYSGSRPGARSEVALRVQADAAATSFVRLAYARVLTPDNGYHSLRSTLTRRILPRLHGTLEAYAYLYDRAIHGYRASTVYACTLEYRSRRAIGLLWATTLVRSPFARLDAQTELRLAYDLDFSTTRGAR